jgi:hypothetical protein
MLSFPAANRDPAMFPDAGRVVIDRSPNRHAAFGLGIHRCLGSHLARMEITVALQEWLAKIPNFSLVPGVWLSGPPDNCAATHPATGVWRGSTGSEIGMLSVIVK